MMKDKRLPQEQIATAADELAEDHLLEDLDEYSKVMRGCLTRRLWRKALKVWEELRWMGLQPKVKQYMWAMKAHSAGSQWEASLAILDELRADDIPEDMGTFMHALMAAKEGKNWELSVNLLNSMSDQQVIPDVGVYNAVLGACDRDQNWPAAELVYKDMQHWGLLPDKITYNTLISASSWAAEEEKGAVLPFDFHEEMKDKVGSDFMAVTTLITACGRWGLWEQALDSLREDQKKGFTRTRTYQAMLGCFKENQWQIVLDLIEEMRRSWKGKPDLFALNKAIEACETGGLWQEALHNFAGMKNFTETPVDEAYLKTISACEKGEAHEIAAILRSELEQRPEVEPWVRYRTSR